MTFEMWHVTCDMWHMTHDTWHVKFDMWHVTCDIYGTNITLSLTQMSKDLLTGFWTAQLAIWKRGGLECRSGKYLLQGFLTSAIKGISSLTRSFHSTPLKVTGRWHTKNKDTEIATYRLNWPRGWFSENIVKQAQHIKQLHPRFQVWQLLFIQRWNGEAVLQLLWRSE